MSTSLLMVSDIKMPSAFIVVNSDIFNEIVTKLLKASDLKMSGMLCVRNTVFTKPDLKIPSVLIVRIMVHSSREGNTTLIAVMD